MPVIGGRFYSPEEIEEMAMSPFDMPPINQTLPRTQGLSQSPSPELVPSGFPRPEPPGAPRVESPPPPPAAAPNISGEPVEGNQIHIQTLPPNKPDIGERSNYSDVISDPRLLTLVGELMKPDTRFSDELAASISQFPQRQKPTKMGRISAMLSGLSTAGHPQREPFAAREIEDALYGDYNRQMADWKTKADILKDAANIERQANVNQRLGGTSILQNEMAQRRLEETIRRNQRAEGQRDVALDQAQQRINLIRDRNEAEVIFKNDQVDDIVFGDDGTAYLLMRYANGNRGLRQLAENLYSPQELMERRQTLINQRTQGAGGRPRLQLRVDVGPDGKLRYSVFNLDTATATPVMTREEGEKIIGGQEGQEPPQGTGTTGGGGIAVPPPKTPTAGSEALEAKRREDARQERMYNTAIKLRLEYPDWRNSIRIRNGRFEGITPPILSSNRQVFQKLVDEMMAAGWNPDADRTVPPGQPQTQPPPANVPQGNPLTPPAQGPPAGAPALGTTRADGRVFARLKGTNNYGWVMPPVDTTKYDVK